MLAFGGLKAQPTLWTIQHMVKGAIYLYEPIGQTKEGQVIRRVEVLDVLIGKAFASQPELPADGTNSH